MTYGSFVVVVVITAVEITSVESVLLYLQGIGEYLSASPGLCES